MTPHQTLAVAVRLFAIWLAIDVTRDVAWYFISEKELGFPMAIAIAMLVVTAAFLAFLWLFPRSVARGLLPLSSDTPAPPSPPEAWLATGTSLIGLWLVATAVPALTRNSLAMYLFRSQSTDLSGLRDGLLYYFLQLVIGIGLIVSANGIRRVLLWARYAGTGKVES
jgi:hypothetical protein